MVTLGMCTADYASFHVLLMKQFISPSTTDLHLLAPMNIAVILLYVRLETQPNSLSSEAGHAACPGSIHLTRFNLSHLQGLPEVLGRREKGISAHRSPNPLEVLGIGPRIIHIHLVSSATERFFTTILQLNQMLNSIDCHEKGNSKVGFVS